MLRCLSKTLVTAPASEPLSLDDAKEHLRLDYDDLDATVDTLITVAREVVEEWTNRALITQTWRAYYAGLGCLVLPKPIAQSVTHVKYYDSTGAANTVTASIYSADLVREPAYITTAYGQQWPSFTGRTVNPVEVEFVAGYGAAAAVPEAIRQAMRLLIGHWFKHPEAVSLGTTAQVSSRELTLGAKSLLENYRVRGTEL